MITNRDPFESSPECENAHEPTWQTLAGCAALLISMIVFWLLG